MFNNHVVLAFWGEQGIYDPSYGAIYRLHTGGVGIFIDEFQNAALAGFYRNERVMGMANGYAMKIRKSDYHDHNIQMTPINIG